MEIKQPRNIQDTLSDKVRRLALQDTETVYKVKVIKAGYFWHNTRKINQ